MKVRVLLDPQGKAIAIQRAGQDASSRAQKDWRAELSEPKGHKFHEVDLPDEFEHIENPQDFYTRMEPHLARIRQ